jgi:hypothetical protein
VYGGVDGDEGNFGAVVGVGDEIEIIEDRARGDCDHAYNMIT